MRYRWMLLAIVAAATGCSGPFHRTWRASMNDGGAPNAYNLPPAQMLAHPGPGVDGPGPGVMMPEPPIPQVIRSSQLAFVGPDGMSISWDVTAPGRFDSEPLIAPGRYNFPQGAIYRLKLTNIPGRPGVELYPTIEIGPTMPRTEAYLAHNPIPIQFTEEDFDQVVLSGNFVTKVIYLPDPEYQELAVAGVETLVSTRLDPGVDPIVEADRRGAIMAVIRVGNIDLQAPGGVGPEGVQQAAYNQPGPGAAPSMFQPGYNPNALGGYVPQAMGPSYVSGVTMPEYGMPITGTPIGLPGPPHIPLGGPAGLQSHTMYNHTPVCIPAPVQHQRTHVRQDPGIAYPKPASVIHLHEQVGPPGEGQGGGRFGGRRGARRGGADCPPGYEGEAGGYSDGQYPAGQYPAQQPAAESVPPGQPAP
ncbi:MAG: hypothetical protein AB7O62_06535 [Pirellulales bacterium]